MTEPVAGVVRGKRFELVDGEGRVRAALVLHEDGTPGLDLWDDNGNVCATPVMFAQRSDVRTSPCACLGRFLSFAVLLHSAKLFSTEQRRDPAFEPAGEDGGGPGCFGIRY